MRPKAEALAGWGVAWLLLLSCSHEEYPPLKPKQTPSKQLALFAGAGLLVSLLMMSYGLDLSPGFF
jgi:hypothetical protein